jgi:hypothetical protein
MGGVDRLSSLGGSKLRKLLITLVGLIALTRIADSWIIHESSYSIASSSKNHG